MEHHADIFVYGTKIENVNIIKTEGIAWTTTRINILFGLKFFGLLLWDSCKSIIASVDWHLSIG